MPEGQAGRLVTGCAMVRIDFNRLRFLIIDDNAHMRRILRQLLHGFGTREVYEAERRPVAAVADHAEVRFVQRVEVTMDQAIAMPMLFDPGHSLDERILREQFGY